MSSIRLMAIIANDGFPAFRRRIAAADEFGFHSVGVGDTPNHTEMYVSLAVAGQTSRQLRLGPMATNTATRHPAVTARSLAALDDLSDGRAFLGIGAGDSALRGIRPHTSLAERRDGVTEIRRCWREDGFAPPAPGTWGARPIALVGDGPKSITLAGEAADVAVIGTGIAPEVVTRTREAVQAGSRRAGRPDDAVETWYLARCAVTDDIDEARARLRTTLAAGANHVFRSQGEIAAAPADLQPGLTRLCENYDYRFHGVPGSNPNASLVSEEGLLHYLLNRFALVGPAEKIAARMRELHQLGVDGFVIPIIGGDPDVTLDSIGRELMPLL